MKRKIELILGTVKSESESWEDVFKRINKDRGLDLKTIAFIVSVVLDNMQETIKKRNGFSLELLKDVQVRNSNAIAEINKKIKVLEKASKK